MLRNPGADLFVPDDAALPAALARVTHLGIGAHQDDLEFMAFHGIAACYYSQDEWFGGVTCTDGAGSARAGAYAGCGDEALRGVRRREQRLAASLGRYAVMAQLDYPSAAIKPPQRSGLVEDLAALLRATRPRVVYTHNLADKHETHLAVLAAALAALRSLPPEDRPQAVHGCEGWRSLDWLPDDAKVLQDVSGHESLAAALNGVFDSQIAGGKRYDRGIIGRRLANATFFDSHSVDRADHLAFAMDLTPLVRNERLDPVEYMDGLLARFQEDVRRKVRGQFGGG